MNVIVFLLVSFHKVKKSRTQGFENESLGYESPP